MISQNFRKLKEQRLRKDIPPACYEFLSAKSKEEQEQLYKILLGMDKYKTNLFYVGNMLFLFAVGYNSKQTYPNKKWTHPGTNN